MPAHYEEVDISFTTGTITTDSAEYGGRMSRVVEPVDHFGFPFIEELDADRVVIRRYTYDQDAENPEEHIGADLGRFGPTAIVRTDKGVTAFAVFDYDEVTETYTRRTWMDLKGFDVHMLDESGESLADKVFKRAKTLGVRSYLYGTFDCTTIGENETDGGVSRVDAGLLTVKVVSVPVGVDELESLFNEKSVDGSVFIRPSLRDALAGMFQDRVSHGFFPDVRKAEVLAEKFRKGMVFDTFRATLGLGFIKALALVAEEDEYLDADIVVYVPNLKSEVSRSDGRITVTMNLDEQGKSVRTNRQVFNLFGEWLYGKNFIYPRHAFSKRIDRMIEEFEAGVLVPTEEYEGTWALNDLAHKFIMARGSYNESQYLLKMMAEAYVKAETPEREDDRRMPVPFAMSMSVRSRWEIAIVTGGRAPKMGDHEIKLTKWGFVLGDSILIDALEILGGADLDDKAELHFRVAATDSPRFHVRQGDIVAVIIRNPVGVSSNGRQIGVEYWVAPVNDPAPVMSRFGEDGNLPDVDLRKEVRPITIPELGITQDPVIKPVAVETAEQTYTKRFVWESIQAAANLNAGMIYGTHVNIMIGLAKHGIPFEFMAPEETFIDGKDNPIIAGQTESLNLVHRELLLSQLRSREIPVDPVDAARLNISDEIDIIEPGDTMFFVSEHRAGVERFRAAASEHITMQFELHRPAEEIDVILEYEGQTQHGEPYRYAPAVLFEALNTERAVGGFTWIPQSLRDEIGEQTFNRVAAKYGELLPEFTYKALMAALYQPEDVLWDRYRNHEHVERGLYYGPMFYVLLEAFRKFGN